MFKCESHSSSSIKPDIALPQQQVINIVKPTKNDVLFGRGVAMNNWKGNTQFRALVAKHKEEYITSNKREKMLISRSIVKEIRSMEDPPGRFLDKDPETGLWADVGDRKAIEKTSQALRDGAAALRQQLSKVAKESGLVSDECLDKHRLSCRNCQSNEEIHKKTNELKETKSERKGSLHSLYYPYVPSNVPQMKSPNLTNNPAYIGGNTAVMAEHDSIEGILIPTTDITSSIATSFKPCSPESKRCKGKMPEPDSTGFNSPNRLEPCISDNVRREISRLLPKDSLPDPENHLHHLFRRTDSSVSEPFYDGRKTLEAVENNFPQSIASHSLNSSESFDGIHKNYINRSESYDGTTLRRRGQGISRASRSGFYCGFEHRQKHHPLVSPPRSFPAQVHEPRSWSGSSHRIVKSSTSFPPRPPVFVNQIEPQTLSMFSNTWCSPTPSYSYRTSPDGHLCIPSLQSRFFAKANRNNPHYVPSPDSTFLDFTPPLSPTTAEPRTHKVIIARHPADSNGQMLVPTDRNNTGSVMSDGNDCDSSIIVASSNISDESGTCEQDDENFDEKKIDDYFSMGDYIYSDSPLPFDIDDTQVKLMEIAGEFLSDLE